MLERIARHQPVGVSELAKLLEEDKSAVQRAILTLADDGWVQAAPGKPTRWELSPHIFAVANMGYGSNDLRQRARRALEQLRDDSGETVLLNVPDVRRFVVVDVVESRHMLRSAPPIGTTVPVRGSATGRAVLPFLNRERQIKLLGKAPDEAWHEAFKTTRANGWSVSDIGLLAEQISVAAPIFEVDGMPSAAVVITAPAGRMPEEARPALGAMVLEAARRLSRI